MLLYCRKPLGLMIYEDETDKPIYYDEFLNHVRSIDKDADIRFGMSKMAIIAPSLEGVVIKIPFSGTYEYFDESYGFNDPIDTLFVTDELDYKYYYEPFTEHEDYCKLEYQKYKQLYRKNLDPFVAATRPYGTSAGFEVYIQEEIITNEYAKASSLRRPSRASKSIAAQITNNSTIAIDKEWLANCVESYGENMTKRFIHYCEFTDYSIVKDLHMGNLGYRKDGTACICDYTGFEA